MPKRDSEDEKVAELRKIRKILFMLLQIVIMVIVFTKHGPEVMRSMCPWFKALVRLIS